MHDLYCVIRKKYLSWHTQFKVNIAMKREKIRLEYLLNADKVVSNDKIVEFHWGKTEQRDAEITAIRAYSFIRFRWLDDENERDYFEIKMN